MAAWTPADRLIDSIVNCFPMLAGMPHAGRPRPDIDTGVRSFPLGRYLIYYQEHARSGILIARVLHAMRDQQKAWDLD